MRIRVAKGILNQLNAVGKIVRGSKYEYVINTTGTIFRRQINKGTFRGVTKASRKEIYKIADIQRDYIENLNIENISEDIPNESEIQLNNLMAQLQGYLGYNPALIGQHNWAIPDYNGSSTEAQVQRSMNVHRIMNIILQARAEHGPDWVMERLYGRFSERLNEEIERLVYAFYDEEYATWSDSHTGFETVISQLTRILEAQGLEEMLANDALI